MAKNTFEKGLSTEFSDLMQPTGTYPNAKNIIRDKQGTVITEPGSTAIVDFSTQVKTNNGLNSFPLPGSRVIGSTTVDNKIYFFIYSQRGSSIVKVDVKSKTADLIIHTGVQSPSGGGGNTI